MVVSPLGQSKAIFERLPDRLFSPLASANRRHYWDLLCALYEKRFGADAPLPPSHGFSSRDIHKDIEEELILMSEWEDEAAGDVDNTVQARAAQIFVRLRETGWLRTERYGVREMITMAPTVAQFLGRIIEFAQTGPLFVAGKVRSIEANLMVIVNGGADGDSLQEAAAQARNLIEHVRNTSTNVRDIMGSFSVEMTTAQYVRRFFTEFIERVFIGDYRELRTRDHPFSRKSEIVKTAEELQANETQRKRLTAWYAEKRCGGDAHRAEAMFERDIGRILDIQRIDEFLDRLDEEVRRANRRALAFLDYRLRSIRPVDVLVNQAIASVLAHPDAISINGFAPGELVSSARLAQPRKEIVKPVQGPLRSQAMSLREEALASLRIQARNRRLVTPPKLAEYLREQFGDDSTIGTDELQAASIEEVRMLQVLHAAAMGLASQSNSLRANAMVLARGVSARAAGDEEVPGAWLSGVPYVLELRRPRPVKQKGGKQ